MNEKMPGTRGARERYHIEQEMSHPEERKGPLNALKDIFPMEDNRYYGPDVDFSIEKAVRAFRCIVDELATTSPELMETVAEIREHVEKEREKDGEYDAQDIRWRGEDTEGLEGLIIYTEAVATGLELEASPYFASHAWDVVQRLRDEADISFEQIAAFGDNQV